MLRARRPHLANGAPTSHEHPLASVQIVIVDQEPLRRSAAAHCSDAMARLEEARAGWHRFEHKDKPAFARWRAREFGPLLSQAREVELQIRDAQALIHEVELEMRRCFQDPQTAYQRVMFRRENPAAAAEQDTARARTGGAGAARKISEFEQEALFQEWVQRSLGTNPDKMDDEAYSTTFEAFKAHMFRSAPPEPRPQNVQRAHAREEVGVEPETEEHQEEETPVDARVKELYRTLVRRLHPDLRADGSAAVSALWHEVQEAYAASDVPRMEILLALSGIGADPLSADTSVSQMRTVVAELTRALRALEKSLREAEAEDAWDFAHTGPVDGLRARVERELNAELGRRTARLELLRATIASWAAGPVANRKLVHVRSFGR
jgi:hypothetical protein